MKFVDKILALLALGLIALLAFTPARATCTGAAGQCTASSGANSPNQNQQQSARSDARASAAAHSRSSSTAASVSNAAGGNATSNAAGGDAGGQQVTYEGSRTPRQTPPAFAGTVQPTASCKGAINAGASTPVAAVSFGKDRPDDECDLRETARMFYEMEERELAVELLCKSKAAQRLTQCAPTIEPIAIDYNALRTNRIEAHGGPDWDK